MPGFMIGGAGGDLDHMTETLRSHRWLITKLGPVNPRRLVIARDLNLPDLAIEQQEVLGGLIWYKFAKAVKWQDAQVAFYDDGGIGQGIEQWKDKIYTNDEGIKTHTPGSGYKMDCEFELLDGHGEVDTKIILKNAWPKVVSEGRLTYTSSEIKLLTVTLAFDWAEKTV